MLVFEERGKPEHREKKPLEAELSHALTCLSSNKEKKMGVDFYIHSNRFYFD